MSSISLEPQAGVIVTGDAPGIGQATIFALAKAGRPVAARDLDAAVGAADRRHESISGLSGGRVRQGALQTRPSVLVPVTVVQRVAVAVVQVVDVIAVLHRFVSAAGTVLMIGVIGVCRVDRGALVPMSIVLMMHMTIVEIVDMAIVFDCGVATEGAVLVSMVLVEGVVRAHERASSACRIAS